MNNEETVWDPESREYLQHILYEFLRACDKMNLKISIDNSKVLETEYEGDRTERGRMEEAVKFN